MPATRRGIWNAGPRRATLVVCTRRPGGGPMETLHAMWRAVRARRDEHRRRARLRQEILGYRTPAEREELLAILERYDMTVDDLLAGRQPPALSADSPPERWDTAWNEIVLDLTGPDE